MNTYHFSRYTLHRRPLLLEEGGRRIRLTSRRLKVLLLLVRAKGEPVLYEAFRKHIWEDACVEQSNLTQTVLLLRRTVGKTASGKHLIETIPKIGYRVAPEAFHDKEESSFGERRTALSGCESTQACRFSPAHS
ncbi:winged helix-turn-helix domain-containing protein [Terriglobus aquaticus]|uniref:Transcriptional regulator n=1 Tax=Terriglobus aquaticus TaxID=940139 RepID=A0ABW9KIR8_9BACT|nr:winged helix-turn-helix domain-containing protein [Terriglobus aquaticus]